MGNSSWWVVSWNHEQRIHIKDRNYNSLLTDSGIGKQVITDTTDHRRKAKVAGLESRTRAASGRILRGRATFCVACRSFSIRQNSRGVTAASFGLFLLPAHELCFVTKFHRRPDTQAKQNYSSTIRNFFCIFYSLINKSRA